MFTLTTWNVNGIRARLPRLLAWLEIAQPDILCLQETKIDNEGFETIAATQVKKLGYEVAHYGEEKGKANYGFNGVAILSRVGIKNVEAGLRHGKNEDPDARFIWAECGGVLVASAYTPNGREVGHDHYFYKLNWLDWLKKSVAKRLADGVKKIAVVGDFNVAPTGIDVWNEKAYKGKTHTSDDERKAWSGVVKAGLTDVFRYKHPKAENIFTFWDYTNMKFQNNQGMRIDHILASEDLVKKLAWTTVDLNARKDKFISPSNSSSKSDDNKPSDHAPVIAAFK